MDIRKFFGGGKAVSTTENKINKNESDLHQVRKSTLRSGASGGGKIGDSLDVKETHKSVKSARSVNNLKDAKKGEREKKPPKMPDIDDEVEYVATVSNVSTKDGKKIQEKRKEPLKRRHYSSEDEVVQPTKKNKRSKILDSDEEFSMPDLEVAVSTSSGGTSKTQTSFTHVIPKPPGKNKKPITASEFFGSSPVQRSAGLHQDGNMDINSNNIQTEDNLNGTLSLSKKLSGKRRRDEDKSSVEEQKTKTLIITDASLASNSQRESSSTFIENNAHTGTHSAKKDEDRRKSYLAFRQREPPKALGSKEIPEGKENCLEGLTFVLTGICESIDRDECKSLIERHGGKVTTNVSRNTKYLVVGRDAGASKIAKANELKTKQIDEDALFDLLRTLPGKKSKYEINAEKETSAKAKPKRDTKEASIIVRQKEKEVPMEVDAEETPSPNFLSKSLKSPDIKSPIKGIGEASEEKSLLWVDKYKPMSMKNIIGQQGDKSQAKKLLNWILNWHKNTNKKPTWGRPSEDGSEFRAALLSGPPGVGKTTTAQIVCQEAGFSFFELNASDTRSKGSLKGVVSEALNCHSLFGFFNNSDNGAGFMDGKKHCIVMDEVDGMAGNEDRGGIQELIQLIKTSHIPIICMCNDRNHQKVRSLANYCFDLRFPRPRKEQIKASMMSIAYKEGIKIPPPALDEIISAANQDIRQVIHNLCMWSAKDKSPTYEQLKLDASRAQKDLHFSPFDVCRKVFSGLEDSKKMTLNDKSDLFFHDYNIAPLFVQENYLAVKPFNAKNDTWKHLSLLGKAASSISMGDLVDGQIRKNQQWGMLPTLAMFASVIPGESMNGAMGSMITFPAWLGKNSTTNKNNRLLQELTLHASLTALCGKQSLNLDYLPALKSMMTVPLVKEGTDGVASVLSIMNAYNFLREDFDNVLELNNWPGSNNPQIDSKVKRAFTTAYNKSSHMMPYSSVAIKKSRGATVDVSEEFDEEEATIEEDDNDITTDAMIMAKKSKPGSTKSKGSSSSKGPEPKKEKQKPSKTRK